MPNNVGLKNIQDVLPASYIEILIKCKTSWSMREHKYDTFEAITSLSTNNHLSHEEHLSAMRSSLIDAVSTRIPVRDVPFAILLSGGLDSSLICRLVADLIYPQTLHTFTITAHDMRDAPSLLDSDCHFARLIAKEATNVVHEEVHFCQEDGLYVLPHVVQRLETTDAAMIRAGVPLYLLSKHISAQGFKVVLCGEGADESMAGYRLFEEYYITDGDQFSHELKRRLFNIDTSELQRVDRCTSAHGLEARVPFLDVTYVNEVMKIKVEEVNSLTLPERRDFFKVIIHLAHPLSPNCVLC